MYLRQRIEIKAMLKKKYIMGKTNKTIITRNSIAIDIRMKMKDKIVNYIIKIR